MKYRYHGTNIDGLILNPQDLYDLYVRDRNLNDIIGNFSYPGAIYHLLTGKNATPSQEKLLDCYLTTSLTSLTEDNAVNDVILAIVASGATYSQAILAGLMVDRTKEFEQAIADFPLDTIGLDRDTQLGLYYIGVIPYLMTIAIEGIYSKGSSGETSFGKERLKPSLANKDYKNYDYIEALFALCSQRNFTSPWEKKIFNDVMVSFHAGCGFLPPTVMLPRVSSSTRAPISQALAAGFTAAGPAHVGACEVAMEFFTNVSKQCSRNLEIEAIYLLKDSLAKKEKIPGFGHPMFKIDPRGTRLRSILSELEIQSDFVKLYDITAQFLQEQFGIYPNIDGISAAIFLSLRIKPKYGTGLFLCSRASAMLAHALEQRQKPPFGATSAEIRKWFGPFAVGN